MQKNGTGLFGSVVPKRPSTGTPKVAQPEQPDGWRRAAGIFSDFASGMLGQPGQYGAMLEQRRQTAEAEASRQRQRGEDFADWRQREDYGRANPDPATPGSFEWYQTANPADQALYDQYNPVTVATGQGPVRVPRNRPAVGATVRMDGLGGGPAPTAPQAPMGAPRVINPRTDAAALDALVTEHGPSGVQRMIDSGQIVLRSN